MTSNTFTISETSPASASTVVGQVISGLNRFDSFLVDADLVGATGGTLDVYLQRWVDTNLWHDWLHFPQLASGASAIRYSVFPSLSNTIVVVGTGTDSNATPALAANTCVGGHPGSKVRAVYVAGASTSAGAAVSLKIRGWQRLV